MDFFKMKLGHSTKYTNLSTFYANMFHYGACNCSIEIPYDTLLGQFNPIYLDVKENVILTLPSISIEICIWKWITCSGH